MSPRHASRPRRHRVSAVGVFGEILLTLGVMVLLFLGWQLWLNDIIMGGAQSDAAEAISAEWLADAAAGDPADAGSDPAASGPSPADGTIAPAVIAPPALNSTFGVLRVPRWGADYARPIAEGTSLLPVLNTIGIGHYVGTQLPGEVGNVALAAHRKAYGGGFAGVPDLQVGDAIVVQTAEGWYTYRFRNLEYVRPTGVGVIDPVPQVPNAEASERYITLTTCNPLFSVAERIAAYGVFESFTPTAAGEPASLAPPTALALAGGR